MSGRGRGVSARFDVYSYQTTPAPLRRFPAEMTNQQSEQYPSRAQRTLRKQVRLAVVIVVPLCETQKKRAVQQTTRTTSQISCGNDKSTMSVH